MTEFIGRRFDGERIVLDGHQFSRCTFHQCLLLYGAAEDVWLDDCVFEGGTQLVLTGAATRTLNLLYQLYHGGLPDYVEGVFDRIRRPPRDPQRLAADPENQPP